MRVKTMKSLIIAMLAGALLVAASAGAADRVPGYRCRHSGHLHRISGAGAQVRQTLVCLPCAIGRAIIESCTESGNRPHCFC